DCFCIGLWQSAQPRLLFACVDPGQCMRLPPSWHVRHWAFCTSTGVPQRLVNPISAVLSSAFLAWFEPGPWQASQLCFWLSFFGFSRKTFAWSVSLKCLFS